MLTNNYLANLLVKDHRKRLLEEARKVRLPEKDKKPEPKVKKDSYFSKIGRSLEIVGLRLQNKKL